MPWRTARPLRGQTRPTWPGGISRRTPVGTAARAPGAITTASLARRSAPAAPAERVLGQGRSGVRLHRHHERRGQSVAPAIVSGSSRRAIVAPAAGYDRGMGRPNLFGMGKRGLAGLVAELRRARLSARASSTAGSTSKRARVLRDDERPAARRCAAGSARRFELRWPEVAGAHALLRRHAQVPVPARRRRHHRERLHPRGRRAARSASRPRPAVR